MKKVENCWLIAMLYFWPVLRSHVSLALQSLRETLKRHLASHSDCLFMASGACPQQSTHRAVTEARVSECRRGC